MGWAVSSRLSSASSSSTWPSAASVSPEDGTMDKDLISALRPALVMTTLFALLLGLAYPLALTGIGQALFPVQANGSLVRDKGRVIGSTVVGQAFTSARYFNTRPRSEEHTSELQSLMRISYAVFCLKKKKTKINTKYKRKNQAI